MNSGRAKEIVQALNLHFFFREGLTEVQPPSLASYSLREMLDAVDEVRKLNGGPSIDGHKHVMMTPDPRLIAALYVAYHYPPEDPSDCNAVALGNGAAVLVVRVAALAIDGRSA